MSGLNDKQLANGSRHQIWSSAMVVDLYAWVSMPVAGAKMIRTWLTKI
jgi:hypothetical protein